jgi:hypothetical protein
MACIDPSVGGCSAAAQYRLSADDDPEPKRLSASSPQSHGRQQSMPRQPQAFPGHRVAEFPVARRAPSGERVAIGTKARIMSYPAPRAGNEVATDINDNQWQSRALARMIAVAPSMNVGEAGQMVAAACTVRALRRLPPEEAAERLISHPAMRAH